MNTYMFGTTYTRLRTDGNTILQCHKQKEEKISKIATDVPYKQEHRTILTRLFEDSYIDIVI